VTIRETTNHYSHGPVTDVTSDQIRCYELNPGTPAPQIATVQAGGTVTFTVDPSIQHPGPLQFYMAKAPSGQTAATFQGTGNVWFKIYEDGPSGLGTSNITWPSSGAFFLSLSLSLSFSIVSSPTPPALSDQTPILPPHHHLTTHPPPN
jgi:hypothetical protein